jgi:LPS-assembly lipoprotein
MSSPNGKKPQVEPTRRALLRGLGLTLVTLPVLTACGEGSFSPMYGITASGENLSERLAKVDIAPIPSRVGQRIRNELIFNNTGGGEAPKPAFRLEIAIREGLNSTLVTSTGEAFSQVYNVDAGYQLISLKDKAVVLRAPRTPALPSSAISRSTPTCAPARTPNSASPAPSRKS